MERPPFRFKKFSVGHDGAAHPLGTDSVLLGAWAPVDGVRAALDIGTGTGAVALMLAQRTEGAVIDAVELHEPSLRCAECNFQASPWADRLRLFGGAIQDFARQSANGPYDLVVSNPPFFTETIVAPDVARRQARSTAALPLSELAEAVRRLLAPAGRFCAVLPPLEGQRLIEIAALHGLYCTVRTEVRTRPEKPVERWLLEFRRDPYSFRRGELVIYEQQGEVYTAAFRALTGAFYFF